MKRTILKVLIVTFIVSAVLGIVVYMKQIKTMDGCEACSNTAYMFTEISGIYPITPSSPMSEHVDEWSGKNRLNIFNDKELHLHQEQQ